MNKKKTNEKFRALSGAVLNSSNMMNESNHAGKKAVINAYYKRNGLTSAEAEKQMIKLYDGGSSFLDEIDED